MPDINCQTQDARCEMPDKVEEEGRKEGMEEWENIRR